MNLTLSCNSAAMLILLLLDALQSPVMYRQYL